MRKRILLALFAGAAVFGSAFAFAAALGLGTHNLAAGDEVVSSCDTDGVVATYDADYTDTAVFSGYTVTSVTVTGIDAACEGHTVGVTLTATDGTNLGDATGPADASGSVVLAMPADVSAEAVEGVHAVIHGTDPTP